MDAMHRPRHPAQGATMPKRLEDALNLKPIGVDDLAIFWMYALFKKHYFGSRLFFTQAPFNPGQLMKAFLPSTFVVQRLERTTNLLSVLTPDSEEQLRKLSEIMSSSTSSLRAIARSILQLTINERDEKRVMYEVIIVDGKKIPGRIIHPRIYRTRND